MSSDNLCDIAERAVNTALKAGAEHADCIAVHGESLSYSQRLGRVETLEQSQSGQLGLRVIKDGRQALVSSSIASGGVEANDLSDLAQRAVTMARAVPQESECAPADPEAVMREGEGESLQLCDAREVDIEALKMLAAEAEDAALAVSGITNSEGAGASWSRAKTALAISNGFCAENRRSQFSVSASLIVGEGENMQTDYDYAITTHWDALPSGADIGARAAARTAAKLDARQAESQSAPVVFDPRAGRALLGHFLSAINGDSICKGTSFLKDKQGAQIFTPVINIIEDPHQPRSLAGRRFDGEGLPTVKRHWVQDGVLQGWLLDLRTARKLGLSSTGNAGRAVSAPPNPSASNVHIDNGTVTQEELLQDIAQGFYVTQMMGMGVNGITGDFSQGAEGFWIENGKKTYPVNEMTIAGNLIDMFAMMTPANDLQFEHRFNVPTLRIDAMTIAGS